MLKNNNLSMFSCNTDTLGSFENTDLNVTVKEKNIKISNLEEIFPFIMKNYTRNHLNHINYPKTSLI